MRSLRPLTEEERRGLEADLKRTKDSAEWKRLFVILSYDEGQSVEDLARLTRLSAWTIEEYLKKYSSHNKTKNDPRGGSSSKLSEGEAKELERHLSRDLGVHGDDAGQFNAFVRSLCWIHEERHYRKLIPFDEVMRQAIEQVRGEIWDLYRGLQEYKIAPSENLKASLEQNFDDLFLKKKTFSPSLNKQLASTYAKKSELLRVLERPETPLHNNGTETDAREMVVKRKVSGGTRSDEGQKCRDTFISLKKTCGKLGITFLEYLGDRINGLFEIPNLAQVIYARSARQSNAH